MDTWWTRFVTDAIDLVATLAGGDETQVQRVLMDGTPAIVKMHKGSNWRREVTGLAAARGGPVASVVAAALDEPRAIRLTGPTALSPADACPDNNVLRDGRVFLVDFEEAQWRHVAWDLAYLTVPWPSCWCGWSIEEDLRIATVAWTYLSLAWALPRDEGRAAVLHRLTLTAPELPELSRASEILREELVSRWGTGRTVHQDNNYASRSDHLGWAYVPSIWPSLRLPSARWRPW